MKPTKRPTRLLGLILAPAILLTLGWRNIPAAVQSSTSRSFVAIADATNQPNNHARQDAVVELANLRSRPSALASRSADAGGNERDLSSSGESRGVTITFGPGIRKSMAEIMATPEPQRPANFEKLRYEWEPEGPERDDLPQNPSAPAVSQFPEPKGTGNQPPSRYAPQTLGIQFNGATGPTETGAFPPDCMGTVGPTQFFVFINGRLRTFTKSTGTADGVVNANPDVFFASVMSTPGAGEIVFTSDPNVRFDRLSSRWFLTIIDVVLSTTFPNPPTRPNRFLIAVSDGPTITAGTVWTFYQFQGDAANFLDYPSLGIDASALYMGGNMFTLPGSFVGTNGYVIPKAPLLAGGPVTAIVFPNLAAGAGAGPFAPRGVDNYDPNNTGPTAVGYFVGVDNATFSTIMFRRVTDPGGTPTISANIPVTVPTTTSVSPVTHLGNTGGNNGRLDALDDRLFAAHLRNGRLWTAHNFRVSSAGVANTAAAARNASRWYEFIVPTSGTPTLNQSGTVFDNAATLAAAHQYWIPSITVSGQGHAAMGISAAGTPFNINAATLGRLAGDVLGTLQGPPNIYTSSSTAYNPPGDPGSSSGRRWGDYSFTSVDPNDDMTMWTIQEYCNGTNSYGVQAVKLIAPPPATPASASPANVTAGQSSVNVTITGTSASGSGFYDPGTNPPGGNPFTHISASVSGGVTVNSVTYTDPTHVTLNISTVGATVGAKNVTLTNPDGQLQTGTGILTIDPLPPFTDISAALTGVYGSVAWGDYDNDGDLDMLVTGVNNVGGNSGASFVYRNDGNGVFTDINAGLPGVVGGSVAWGDYDNDGDLDILLTGSTNGSPSGAISKIYRNDGGVFTDIAAGLTGVYNSSVAWGDYDNDGDLDILLTGQDAGNNKISKVYRNDNGTFTDIAAGLTGVMYSSVAWGDYDNDGDLDILLTGFDGANYLSKVYRNTGGTFTDINAGLVGILQGSVAWGDYDNDGDLDILLAGNLPSGRTAKVYFNDNGTFTDINAGLTGVSSCSVAWGDYDNDGNLDILLSGYDGANRVTKVYRNNVGTFTDINAGLIGVSPASVAWGDYDNDGDLDILLTGLDAGTNRIAKVYRNNTTTPNTVPTAPTGLVATPLSGNRVAFSWNPSSDGTRPVTGKPGIRRSTTPGAPGGKNPSLDGTPLFPLSYNLRVGTTPGGINTLSPMANVNTPINHGFISDGWRKVARFGPLQTLRDTLTLPPGQYYWSVQAIDAALAGGPFAAEGSFNSTPPVAVTVTTSPAGLVDTVDGTPYTSSQTFQWIPGSSHTIGTTTPQSGGAGTQYAFNNWSDAGAISHTVLGPASATTYTASFDTQYQLTTSAGAGGTIAPPSGFYNRGNVQVTAAANPGFAFTGFSGALTGLTNPQTLNLTAPASVAASFGPADPCSFALLVGTTSFQDSLWAFDTTSYSVQLRVAPTLAGFTITGSNSITFNPHDNLYYAIVKVSGVTGRELVTINPFTGVCALRGNLGDNFSSITFTPAGKLYGATGAGATVRKTLYEINPLDATKTVKASIPNGADGDIIAFNSDDGYIYHWAGNGTNIFEKIDTTAFVSTGIPQSGASHGEIFGAVYKGNGAFYTSDIGSRFFTQTTAGVSVLRASSLPDDIRGLAFTSHTPEIDVQGNGVSIVDGDVTPSPADFTEFGNVTTGSNLIRTFTVHNAGVADLNVTNINTSGADNGLFTVGALTPASPVPPGASATFTVTFAPTTIGLKTATVNIANNDCDESAYDFALEGTGTAIVHNFVVVNINDAGVGSLRQAITDANTVANIGPSARDTISFNIPGGGSHVIAPLSPLPAITDPVVVDGYSQPGASPGVLKIAIIAPAGPIAPSKGPRPDLKEQLASAKTPKSAKTTQKANNPSGLDNPPPADGLTVNAGNTTVQGLVISAFGGNGIVLNTAGGDTLWGNFIGTDLSGTIALGNGGQGVVVNGTANNVIGGPVIGQGNLISGNTSFAIYIAGGNGNTVKGNRIGTNITGTTALANSDGVVITGANNVVGGSTAGEGNLISGNTADGIFISLAAANNSVKGNLLGTDVNGTADLGNGSDGVAINAGSANNTIGGTTPGERNIISGNNRFGIYFSGAGTTGNRVIGNYIGTDVTGTNLLGNTSDGVLLYPQGGNSVGGTNAGEGNIIAGNGRAGVDVIAGGNINNPVLGNSIFNNVGLGIDLSATAGIPGEADGLTANDVADADTGANRLQNFPVITQSTRQNNGDLSVTYNVSSSVANSTYPLRIEVFKAQGGEGKTLISAQSYTSANAQLAVTQTFTPAVAIAVGDTVVATATDANGNTSEFSAARAVVPADPSGIISDDFNTATLKPFWTFINPGNPSAMSLVGTSTADARLRIQVPDGASHDVWTSGNMAPRVMQNCNNIDFEVEVKFDGQMTSQYQIEGIIVEQDANTFLRFDFVKDNAGTRAFAAQFTGGAPTPRSDLPIPSGNPSWMRVKRQGNTWTQSYSYDGVHFTVSATFDFALAVSKIGPFIGNAGYPEGTAPSFTGLVDYFFSTASPIVPEDGVLSAPTITQQPLNATVSVGQTATFTVAATGTIPLAYQWQKNSVDVGGATNPSYTTPPTSGADNGASFRCVVSNSVGTVTSNAAVLTVNAGGGASGILSDDFNAATLKPFWTYINPAAPSTLTLVGTNTQDARLSIAVPAGSAHDVWTGANNAPRIMQPMNNTDFEVEVKFEQPMSAGYQLEGVIVEQSPGNYLRFGFVHDFSNTRLFAASFTNNNPSVKHDINITGSIGSRAGGGTVIHDYLSETGTVAQGAKSAKSPENIVVPVSTKVGTENDAKTAASDGAVPVNTKGGPGNIGLASASTLYLRVKRTGNSWTEYYSTNGSDYFAAPAFTQALTASSVGPYIGNAGSTPSNAPAFTGLIDYFFNTAAPISPEDGTPSAPLITSQPQDQTVGAGQAATFAIGVSGSAPLQFRWQKNNIDISLATNPSYTTPSTTLADDGTLFRCIVSNSVGTVTSNNAILHVTSIPNPSGIFSDDFHNPTLDNRWVATNPAPASSFSLVGSNTVNARLSISIPSGQPHDIWTGGNNAPRIMQPANNTDFGVEVKFEQTMTSAYQFEGILAQQDVNNFIRFGFVKDNGNTRVFAASFVNGTPTTRTDINITQSNPLYVRVNRTGDQWLQTYSNDGTNFTSVGPFTHALTVSSVGLYAGNASLPSTPAPAFTMLADYFFNTAFPIVPEDGGPVVTPPPGGLNGGSVAGMKVVPTEFSLGQNFPNPFNPSTTISYGLPEQANVTLKVYNTLGQEMAVLTQGEQAPGMFRAVWDGRNKEGNTVGSGVYLYRIVAIKADGKSFTSMGKMILMK